ncbi:hypothetical protein HOR11_gp028 [Lactobacillus phage SA-C12]|uniref:Uncharacterized protein n=1 Tax=Lactobacillus phage SA-C12 TaxID=1755697 RepID=A0A1I9KKD0_9CAUD|nr:hypothetical protein HOR11_gp028 [Lactobacillus phage SA-C12]ALY06850.1 hypothetical protein SAC12_028 [Lactobacillus phage SA-C12]
MTVNQEIASSIPARAVRVYGTLQNQLNFTQSWRAHQSSEWLKVCRCIALVSFCQNSRD